jgi:hypothetical protein
MSFADAGAAQTSASTATISNLFTPSSFFEFDATSLRRA